MKMPDASALRLLVWRAGPVRCGALLDRLREVIPAHPVVRIPGAPPAVRGIANVRGELVTVVDCRMLLGLGEVQPGRAVILADVRGRTVGLEVDDVEDLAAIPDVALRPAGTDWEARIDDGDAVRLLDLEGLLDPLFPE